MNNETEVDLYGVPLGAFGEMPPEFFEILGRIVAVNGKIEYLKARLDHLPAPETGGIRKVEQFLKRYDSGRMDRNAVVHSNWVSGANTIDPDVVVGARYKVRKLSSGTVATVSIRDSPGTEQEQDIVEYTLTDLRKLLKHDLVTMHIGQQAYTEVMLNWAALQDLPADSSSPVP